MGDAAAVRALALDPSMTSTGYAIGSTDGARPVWGTIRSASWGVQEGKHLAGFVGRLEELLRQYAFTQIFYEKVFISNVSGIISARSKIMLEGAILTFCHEWGLKVADVPLQSWRSRFIGTTQAPPHFRQKQDSARKWLKERAIWACAERGWLTDSDDEAEALGILDYGLASLSPAYASRTDSIFRRVSDASAREAMVRG